MKTCLILAVCLSACAALPLSRNHIAAQGRPGCRTQAEITQRFWRNTDDPVHYWECLTLNQDATRRRCPDSWLYLESRGECVIWSDWTWTRTTAPPSLGAPDNGGTGGGDGDDNCVCTTPCACPEQDTTCPPCDIPSTSTTTTTTPCPPCVTTTTPCECPVQDTTCPPCPEPPTTTTTTTTPCPPCVTTTTPCVCPPTPCPPCDIPTTTPCPPCEPVEEQPFVCTHDRMHILWPVNFNRAAYLQCSVLNGAPENMPCPQGTFFEFTRQTCV